MRIPDRIRAIDLPPFDPLNGRAAVLREQGHHVISLGQALPFFPPPPSAIDAARAALDGREVHIYSTDPGRSSLRHALAARLAQTLDVDATAGNLVITAGANHAFTLALTTLVDPGDEVILPSPYFTNHEMSVRAAGAIAVEAPVADRETFAITWADIEPHLTTRTRAVVLCTPSNPTGAVLTPADGTRIVDELARRRLVLFSDETYLHFSYDRPHWSAASAAGWRQTVVVVGTCSKSFGMMGWRVGFVLADAAVCAQMVKVQDAMIICAPVISQIAAEHAIADDWNYPLTFADDMRRRRQLLADGIRGIPRLSWMPTGGGLFGFVRVAGCTDSEALSTELLESAHVVTIPGAVFGRAGEGCLRLSYGAASEPDLATAVQRLAAFFAGRASHV